MTGIRFTKDVVDAVLRKNEGKSFETVYKARNFRESNVYSIHDGKMTVRSSGKSSCADSRFDTEKECDLETTRRILRKFMKKLDV